MRVRSVMVGAIALGLALSTSGCAMKDSLDARFTPAPTKVTIEATVAAADASVDGEITKGFPDTVPMWPGARVSASKTTKTPQGKSYSAVLTTRDPYTDVLAGVGEGLRQCDWKVEVTDASSSESTVSILMISDGEAEGIVTISQAPDKPVRIEYIITPKS